MAAKTKRRLKLVCKHCGGDQIKVDAWARWDVNTQRYRLIATLDAAYCETCGGETSTDMIRIKGN